MDLSKKGAFDQNGKKWFLFIEEEHIGPFSGDEIQTRIDQGQVHPSDQVWAEGMTEWIAATDFARFRSGDGRDRSMRLSTSSLEAGSKRFSWTRARRKRFWRRAVTVAAGLGVFGFIAYSSLRPEVFKMPQLSDVSREDLESLRQAIQGNGAKLSVAISNIASMTPTFYVSGNYPDGTDVQVQLDGVPGTMIGLARYSRVVGVKLSKGWTRTPPFHQANGLALPPGEYHVTARVQGSPVGDVSKKGYFLGGQRDAQYQQKLATYLEAIRQQATQELSELKQFAVTLEDQLSKTSDRFQKLAQRAALTTASWQDFSVSWTRFQDQLTMTFDAIGGGQEQDNLFYDSLFVEAHEVGVEIGALHRRQGDYFAQPPGNARDQAMGEIVGSESIIQSRILKLKRQIQAIELSPRPKNGMPATSVGQAESP